MLTLRRSGALSAVRDDIAGTERALRNAGFDVVRTKTEAAPWADGEAAALGARYHFEHHIKLLLAPGPDTAPLSAHAAHLSRNARRVRADGRTAGDRPDAPAASPRAVGHEIVSVEREFVVHDSNESLDAGWIAEEEGTDA